MEGGYNLGEVLTSDEGHVFETPAFKNLIRQFIFLYQLPVK